jgi:hypothetical protein
MEPMPTFPTIAAALDDLVERGTTADGIAKILDGYRVRATCRDARHCAIAEYLRATVPGVHAPLVFPSAISGNGFVQWFDDTVALCEPLPPAVDQFAVAFDQRSYRDLIDPRFDWPQRGH